MVAFATIATVTAMLDNHVGAPTRTTARAARRRLGVVVRHARTAGAVLALCLAAAVAVVCGKAGLDHQWVRRVRGMSMEPTIADGAFVLVLPATPATAGRGDVVLLESPWTMSGPAVKRLTGVPGDCVGNDGVRVDEMRQPCLVVGSGTLFVVGDNRTHSTDSRQLGAVRRRALTGRAVAVLWPPWRWRRLERTLDAGAPAGTWK